MAITHVGTAGTAGANSATISPTWPAGTAADDVAYVFWTMQNTTTPSPNPPTNFTQVATADSTGGSGRTYIFRRVLPSTQAGTLTLTCAASQRHSACLAVYRGVDTTTPEDSSPAVDDDHTGETTTHNCPAETTVAANCVIVTSIHERASTIDTAWTEPTGYTERADTLTLATGTGGTITAVADLLTPQAAGAVVTPPVWTGNSGTGTPNIVTYTLALRPAATATFAPPPGPAVRRIQHLLVR